MRRLALCPLLFAAACAPPTATAPLLVGPGPCSTDAISRDRDTGEVLSGCVGVLLVEATRDAASSRVAGRVLAAGSLDLLPGVNVVVVGRPDHGVSTDRHGRFVLPDLQPSDRLAVQYVGFWPDTLSVRALPGPRVD